MRNTPNSSGQVDAPGVTLNLGKMFASEEAAKAYKATGENWMLTFRAHTEKLAGEPIDLVKAKRLQRLQKTGRFHSLHTLKNACRVCVLTDTTGEPSTTLLLQSEYEAGKSSKILHVHATRPMHEWGSSDIPSTSPQE